jgi:hypothetical protein
MAVGDRGRLGGLESIIHGRGTKRGGVEAQARREAEEAEEAEEKT